MPVKRQPSHPRHEIPEIVPAGGTGSLDAARPTALGSVKRFLRVLGPGLITGASDDDPSGIGTYAIAGASFGFATLWMALITLPMLSSVQFMCAKIGMVTGRGLSGVLKAHYPRPVSTGGTCDRSPGDRRSLAIRAVVHRVLPRFSQQPPPSSAPSVTATQHR
jgi:hypothetical protein